MHAEHAPAARPDTAPPCALLPPASALLRLCVLLLLLAFSMVVLPLSMLLLVAHTTGARTIIEACSATA